MVEEEPLHPRRKEALGPAPYLYSFCFAFGREGKSVCFCHPGLDITSEHYRRHGRIDTSPHVHHCHSKHASCNTNENTVTQPRHHCCIAYSHCTVFVLRPAALCSISRSSPSPFTFHSLASEFEGENKMGGHGTKMGLGTSCLRVDLRGRRRPCSVDVS